MIISTPDTYTTPLILYIKEAFIPPQKFFLPNFFLIFPLIEEYSFVIAVI